MIRDPVSARLSLPANTGAFGWGPAVGEKEPAVLGCVLGDHRQDAFSQDGPSGRANVQFQKPCARRLKPASFARTLRAAASVVVHAALPASGRCREHLHAAERGSGARALTSASSHTITPPCFNSAGSPAWPHERLRWTISQRQDEPPRRSELFRLVECVGVTSATVRVVRRGFWLAVVLLVLGCLVPAPAMAQEWYELYANGERALRSNQPQRAADLLQRAIQRRPQPGLAVPTYGTNFEPRYFPYLRLAEAYLRTEAFEEALKILETSARFGVEPGAERTALEGRVRAAMDAKRPPPKPAPLPASTPPPDPPPALPPPTPVTTTPPSEAPVSPSGTAGTASFTFRGPTTSRPSLSPVRRRQRAPRPRPPCRRYARRSGGARGRRLSRSPRRRPAPKSLSMMNQSAAQTLRPVGCGSRLCVRAVIGFVFPQKAATT